ncbi:unnamed protein product [Mycena citricolor]|uniref:Uncharacterized protein n=1 Tax=Mycena citricolor TaxID=2018698 RepID=A0AAD2HIY4_9AGAR|nr:unnamed protein product [Mycena citricolor]CAK5276801.1 unnamed protein product [Mycena citricolor]
MPALQQAKSANAALVPTTYTPVLVVVGGTSAIGAEVAKAFARHAQGRAHIIIVGRSERSARAVLDAFPRPDLGTEFSHEFLLADVTLMSEVRALVARISEKLQGLPGGGRINYLFLSASSPVSNSLMKAAVTTEGLGEHLASKYFARYLIARELLPLLARAHELDQVATLMTVLAAGNAVPLPTTDLDLAESRRAGRKWLDGAFPRLEALKGMQYALPYNDALVAHFHATNPWLSCTHTYPGQVLPPGKPGFAFGYLMLPLTGLVRVLRYWTQVPLGDCGEYQLHALLAPGKTGGVFLRGKHADLISSVTLDKEVVLSESGDDSIGVLAGHAVAGYGGSDARVAKLIHWTDGVLEKLQS